MHCFPRGKNDELYATLWWLICCQTQKVVLREKFSLQVTARIRVKPGFSDYTLYEDWQRDILPELIVSGVKFIDNGTN